MEGTLRVTPEQLESTASEFSNKATAVGTLTTTMMDTVMGLSSSWEGEASTAYTSRFKELSDDIQRMINMIKEHSTDLTEMAQVYRQAETANTEEAQALAGDVIV